MTTRRRTSSYISGLIISLLLLPLCTAARTGKDDAASLKNDSTPLFRSVAVAVDVVGLGQIAFSDYGQYEAQLRVNLKDRWFPVVELGYGTCDTKDETTGNRYKTSAPYGRIGCDFNIMKNKHDIYRIYIGARYAFTSFKYDIDNPRITDPVWHSSEKLSASNVSGNCHWYEAGGGIDVRIAGPLRLGWSVRYRGRLANKNGGVGKAWYVPGYGRNGTSRIGGTFNVIIEL